VEKLWVFKVFISYKNYKIIFIYILVVATTHGYTSTYEIQN